MLIRFFILLFYSIACFGEEFKFVCIKSGQGFVRGEGTYSDGDVVNLLAVAQPDWKFERWVINGAVFTNNSISIIANKNTSAEVLFVKHYGNNVFLGGTVAAWGFIDGREYVDPQELVPKDLSDVVSISAGYFHSVALRSDGKVVVWGKNFSNQTNIPVGLSGVMMVSAGGYHSVVLIDDGSIISWGGNPNLVPPKNLGSVVSIAAGMYHTVALKIDGSVVAWGDSNAALNGFNSIQSLRNIKAIAAGGGHSLALKADGTVVSWGSNEFGQTSVPVGLSNVVAISAGESHSVALKADGTVVGWGSNRSGQLSSIDTQTDIVGISAGCTNTVLIKSNGKIVGGGFAIPSRLSSVVAVSAGRYHILALRSTNLCVFGRVENLEAMVEEGEIVDKTSKIINSDKFELFKNGLIANTILDNRIYFKNAKTSDSGLYTLVAYGKEGDATCYQIKINVVPRGYPRIWVDEQVVSGGVLKGELAVVKITSSLVNSQLFYTVDGSDPDFTSKQYLGPLTIDRSVVVKALVFSEDFSERIYSLPSSIQIVRSFTFLIDTLGGGRIEQKPLLTKYVQDEVVSVKAVPKDGFKFLRWGEIYPERFPSET